MRNMAKYLPPMLVRGSVIARMLPITDRTIGMAMCRARSLRRVEDHATTMEAKKAKK
jgi:hypothetical protein